MKLEEPDNTIKKETKKLMTCALDYDGVIVDSEYIHSEAKRITLDYLKIEYNQDILSQFKGYPDHTFFEYVQKYRSKGMVSIEAMLGLKNSLYRVLFKKVNLVNGILDFLDWAKNNFINLAVVSSASKQDIELGLEKYELTSFFKTIISGDDTKQRKPNPEPYCLMSKLLHLNPKNIIAIEDSPTGVLSAKNAGCRVFAITTTFPKEELFKAGADSIVSNFNDIQKTIIDEQNNSTHTNEMERFKNRI